MNDTDRAIVRLKQVAPYVGKFFDNTEKLAVYANRLHNPQIDNTGLQRQESIKQAITSYSQTVLTPEELTRSPLDLAGGLTSNVVDHHGIWNHPISYGADLLADFGRLNDQSKTTVVLSSSNVALNNFFHRKGFQFHGRRVPLFTQKDMHKIAYRLPAQPLSFVDKAKNIKLDTEYSNEEFSFLERYEARILKIIGSRYDRYIQQISRLNYELWPDHFEERLRANLCPILLVPQEVVMESVLPSLLKENNIVSWSLFDPSGRANIFGAFRGITGCWDEDSKKGTHFFWHPRDDNENDSLWLRGNTLTNADGSFTLSLEPQAIGTAIEQGTIYPNLFVIFAVLLFYAGVKPLAGYGSINYLNRMKQAWLQVLPNEFRGERTRIEELTIDGFVGGPTLAFRRENGKLVEQYSADIFYTGGLTKEYLEKLGEMTFGDLLVPTLADIFGYYILPPERDHYKIDTSALLGEKFSWIK